MTLSSSLLLLLLLLGLSQANPLWEEGEPDAPDQEDEEPDALDQEDEEPDALDQEDEDPDAVDISTRILTTNNATEEFLLEGDLLPLKSRNAIRCGGQSCLWKKGNNGKVRVPYTLSHQFTHSEKNTIQSALKSFSSISCIRFVSRTNEYDFLDIQSKGGCFSSLGREGGRQVLSLNKQGCIYRGIIQHEALHALGFRHEHNRSDRDQYVKMNWKNMLPQMAYNFYKQNTNNLNAPYDYSSIMHYGKTAFSLDGRMTTITPIPNPNVQIGQRQRLSRLDAQKLNSLYRC